MPLPDRAAVARDERLLLLGLEALWVERSQCCNGILCGHRRLSPASVQWCEAVCDKVARGDRPLSPPQWMNMGVLRSSSSMREMRTISSTSAGGSWG